MKTAEEWMMELAHQYVTGKTNQAWPQQLLNEFKPTIELIQLDAMKEGMRRAAQICDGNGQQCSALPDIQGTCEQLNRTILAAAEQLTEKDL